MQTCRLFYSSLLIDLGGRKIGAGKEEKTKKLRGNCSNSLEIWISGFFIGTAGDPCGHKLFQ